MNRALVVGVLTLLACSNKETTAPAKKPLDAGTAEGGADELKKVFGEVERCPANWYGAHDSKVKCDWVQKAYDAATKAGGPASYAVMRDMIGHKSAVVRRWMFVHASGVGTYYSARRTPDLDLAAAIFKAETDVDVRGAMMLSVVGVDPITGPLSEAAKAAVKAGEPKVTGAALMALVGNYGEIPVDVVDLLVGIVEDPTAESRTLAMTLVARSGDPRLRPLFEKVLADKATDKDLYAVGVESMADLWIRARSRDRKAYRSTLAFIESGRRDRLPDPDLFSKVAEYAKSPIDGAPWITGLEIRRALTAYALDSKADTNARTFVIEALVDAGVTPDALKALKKRVKPTETAISACFDAVLVEGGNCEALRK